MLLVLLLLLLLLCIARLRFLLVLLPSLLASSFAQLLAGACGGRRLRRAEAGACAARRQARAQREGRRPYGWLGKAAIAGPSAHPPARLLAHRLDRSAPSLALPLSSHPFFAPSSIFFLPPPICVCFFCSLSHRGLLCRFTHASFRPPRANRSAPGRAYGLLRPPCYVFCSLLCCLSSRSPTCAHVPRRTCHAVRAAPYVLRRAVRATPCAPRRACHAVRGQICLKDVLKNGCTY